MEACLTSMNHDEIRQRPYETLLSEVEHQQPDLLIVHIPLTWCPVWWKPNMLESRVVKQMPVSLLIARNPRWPLQKILLVLRDSKYDAAAIAWILQIASRSGASVTVLPLIASLPPVYAGINLQHHSLTSLLGSTCTMSKTLRRVSQDLAGRNIQGTLRLREGTITDQIRDEFEENDFDLAVIAADTQPSIVHWLMGELVNPLLNVAQIPILVAKPA
jgi:nucleotide-binding universal stress UspA family protein